MADSIRKFDSKSNRTADFIRDSIRTQKNDSQVPSAKLYVCSECTKQFCSADVLKFHHLEHSDNEDIQRP